ncbi:hypothetical protein ABER99_21315 [Paenibacillus glucanolyticus]|jgi:hypothetical protein|uniref:Uncharacterized protein n=1 Tax=Paenibacillus glucanolyticus TaxID=59843 RepID=A0A163G6U1_9BACL|nr:MULTISPECIES: hypothetical protein [Paenibacillus]KZS44765.1 hypothetical protein AWU65_01880 [Paenibacillus glucanolyticus]MDH6675642.1 hypothetical protein [Paenibacillus sp. LBL]OMF64756.1 hypothetical protein BK142_31715 [Paenibacillus glucanolyticus]
MNKEKKIRSIGEKVSARYKSFFNQKLERVHSAWIPYIQADGEMLPIYDPGTISGQKEATSKYKALKLAEKTRDELVSRSSKI